jgi:hypothetical protein
MKSYLQYLAEAKITSKIGNSADAANWQADVEKSAANLITLLSSNSVQKYWKEFDKETGAGTASQLKKLAKMADKLDGEIGGMFDDIADE